MSRLRVFFPGSSDELLALRDAKWTQRKGESDELTFKYPANAPYAELLTKPQQLDLRAANGTDVLRTFTIATFVPPRSRIYGDVPLLEIVARARSLDELLDTVITEYPVIFTLDADLPLPETWTGGYATQVATVKPQPDWETIQWGAGDTIADVFGAAHVSRARINHEIVKPYQVGAGGGLYLTRKQPGLYVDRSWVGGGDAEDQPEGAKVVFQHNLKTHLYLILHYFQDKTTPGAGPITLGDVTFTGYDPNEFYEFHLDGMSIREALDVLYVTAGRPGVMYIDDNGALQWRNKSGLTTWDVAYGGNVLREYRATPNYEKLVTRVYAIGAEVDGERVKLQTPVDRNTALYGVIETTLTFEDAMNEEELEVRAEAHLDEYAEPLTTYDLVAWEGDTPRMPGHAIRLQDTEYDLDVTAPISERVRDLDSPLATYRIGAEPIALEEILQNMMRSRRMALETYTPPEGTGGSVVPPEVLAHLEDTENPHAVTKDQVGLDLVDNVRQLRRHTADPAGIAHALATWHGTDADMLRSGSLVRSYQTTEQPTLTQVDTTANSLQVTAGHGGNNNAMLALRSGTTGKVILQYWRTSHGGVEIHGPVGDQPTHTFSRTGAAYHAESVTAPKFVCPATHVGLWEFLGGDLGIYIQGEGAGLHGGDGSATLRGAVARLIADVGNVKVEGNALQLRGASETAGTVRVVARYYDPEEPGETASSSPHKIEWDCAGFSVSLLELSKIIAIVTGVDDGGHDTGDLEIEMPSLGIAGQIKIRGRHIVMDRTFPIEWLADYEDEDVEDTRMILENKRGHLEIVNSEVDPPEDPKVIFKSPGGIWDDNHRLGYWAPYAEPEPEP